MEEQELESAAEEFLKTHEQGKEDPQALCRAAALLYQCGIERERVFSSLHSVGWSGPRKSILRFWNKTLLGAACGEGSMCNWVVSSPITAFSKKGLSNWLVQQSSPD